MIANLKRAGKSVVYVNCSGSALGLVSESQYADAILQAWYGGEQGGQAVADILFGDYNPTGKLPVTFYQHAEQLPDFEDYRMAGRTYRYFKGDVHYPFGYGMSYTTFQTSKPVYRNGKVSVSVKNTGKRAGTEVVQVYVRNPKDTEGPLKTLRAYQRVQLKAGESKVVSISLPRNSFELWDAESNTMRVVPGQYEVMVGTSSQDKDLKKTVAYIR
jgi:beta-glucosidase